MERQTEHLPKRIFIVRELVGVFSWKKVDFSFGRRVEIETLIFVAHMTK